MQLALSAEQEELRRAARRFLDDHAGPVRARALLEHGQVDAGLWPAIAALGWPAIAVPEERGGVGLGVVELAVIFEEAGRALLAGPLFSVVLAEQVLLACGSEAQQAAWLPRLAEGETIATLVSDARVVTDGAEADLLLVARDGQVFLVDGKHAERRRLTGIDPTQAIAEVNAPGGEPLPHPERLQDALDRAAVALAASALGGAQRCLDLAVEYAGTRVQFGRPIGSFQAIKHKCADLFVAVESARSAVFAAAAAEGTPGFGLAAATAKAWCGDAYFQCASEALQIHGGIGFTWEHEIHLHLRRARTAMALLGDADSHRERVAAHLLDAPEAR